MTIPWQSGLTLSQCSKTPYTCFSTPDVEETDDIKLFQQQHPFLCGFPLTPKAERKAWFSLFIQINSSREKSVAGFLIYLRLSEKPDFLLESKQNWTKHRKSRETVKTIRIPRNDKAIDRAGCGHTIISPRKKLIELLLTHICSMNNFSGNTELKRGSVARGTSWDMSEEVVTHALTVKQRNGRTERESEKGEGGRRRDDDDDTLLLKDKG